MTHAPSPDFAEHRFPCDQCGADYRFDPKSGTLICDHCGHSEPISSGPWGGASLRELDFDAAITDRLPDSEIEETRVLSCPNCAAQVEFDPNTEGSCSATLSISNNDSNEDPYNFGLHGTGIDTSAPEIDVRWYDNDQSSADEDTSPTTSDGTVFGSAEISTGSVVHSFLI